MKQGTFAFFTLVLLLPAAAFAQQKGVIELKSVSHVEVVTTTAIGKKEVRRVEAAKTRVVPGDIVFFTTEYRNIGNQPAGNVVITNPVPEHTVYVDKSAAGKGTRIDFSVDGGRSYHSPDRLAVKDARGKKRKAVAADYTNIRWTVTAPVAPGKKGEVSFRAKIK